MAHNVQMIGPNSPPAELEKLRDSAERIMASAPLDVLAEAAAACGVASDAGPDECQDLVRSLGPWALVTVLRMAWAGGNLELVRRVEEARITRSN